METQPAASARRSGLEWFRRSLFGVLLIGIAVAVLVNPLWFAAATVLVSLFAAHEWHRLVRTPATGAAAIHKPLHLQTAITALAVALAIGARLAGFGWAAGITVLALGAVASFVLASRLGDTPFWHAAGPLYIGLPALAIVALRSQPALGLQTVLGVFLIVWATDTGAFFFGKLIGGPKMVPNLSPGKTWAGTIGGSVTAAIVYGLYIGILGFNMLEAMGFALLFSVAAHAGDLLESAVKRHFGKKDSGAMIPGHGGVLDRMDSTILASLVMALLVFGFHLNPLFGGQS
jgi:phosphatidate cytidylyltransferase